MRSIFFLLFLLPFTSHSQIIQTIAGNGTAGFAGDGGVATSSMLNNPSAVWVSGNGALYITDRSNNRVRKIDASGMINTVAGTGVSLYTGDGGPATAADLYQPMSIAEDPSGNIYMSFYFNHYIRKVNSSGIITTIAGNTFASYYGDGGPSTAAGLNTPWGFAADRSGNLYFADQWNNRIRKISPSGIITTVAGNGVSAYLGDGGQATAASLNRPNGVAVDAGGNLYIGDGFNCRVRKVSSTGIITTLAGDGTVGSSGDGGPATAAKLFRAASVAVDGSGNVFIADYGNNKIRMVNTAGIITTVAGTGTSGYSGDGGPATAADMGTPFCIAIDSFDNIYVADHNNHRVRKISNGLCVGATIALSNGAPGGTWSSSNTAIATVGASTGIVTAVFPGTAIISYVVGAVTTNYPVKVDPMPSAGSIIAPDSVCAGATVTLSNMAAGGNWLCANTNASVSKADLTGIAAGYDTIFYTVTNSCGTVFTSKLVLIKPLPVAGAIAGPDSVCMASSITLSATLSGGAWSRSNSFASLSGSVVTGLAAGIDTIFYVMSNYCGSDTVRKRIIVKPLPYAGIITGKDTVCAGASIKLTDATAGGAWNRSNSNASVSAGLVTGITAGADTIFYIVANYCGVDTARKTIVIMPRPYAGIITGKDTVCAGASIKLTDLTGGGSWERSNSNASVAGGVVTGILPGIDTIFYIVSNYCGADTAKRPVTIKALPYPGTITGADSVCVGAAITLSDAVPGGTWKAVNGNASVMAGVVSGITQGKDTIIYLVTNSCGSDSSVKVIKVNPLPFAGGITGLSVVCPGFGTMLTAGVTGGVWSVSTGAASVASGLVSEVVPGIDTISYSVTNSCGSDRAIHVVTLVPVPDAGVISGDSSVCKDSILKLTDAMPGGVWTSGNTAVAKVTAGLVTGILAGAATISYTISNVCGSATTKKVVYVKSRCTTGLENVSIMEEEVEVYPNPAQDELHIASGTIITSTIITDLQGRVIYRAIHSAKDVNMDVSGLSNGIYFVKINDRWMKKFVKQ